MINKKSLKTLLTAFISFCLVVLPTASSLAAAMTVDLSNGRTRNVRITTGNIWPSWSKTYVYVYNNGNDNVHLYPQLGPGYYAVDLYKGQQKGFEITGRYKSYYLKLAPFGRRSPRKVYITVSGSGSKIQVVN